MSKELVEVRPAQPCEVHFASDRSFVWVGTQDIERDATDQREVLWCVVFTCSGCVLVEADVQVPMQLVLDAPMRAHQLEQPLRRQDRRQGHIAHRFSTLPPQTRSASMRANAASPGNAGASAGAGSTLAQRHSLRSCASSAVSKNGRKPLASACSNALTAAAWSGPWLPFRPSA